MPDYPEVTLTFTLGSEFDHLPLDQQARILLHHFLDEGQQKMPNLERINCRYTGSGDSFEDAQWEFFGDTGEDVATYRVHFFQDTTFKMDNFIGYLVSTHYPGWENNEGGYGDVTFDLKRRAVTLSHFINVSESHHAGEHVVFDDSEGEASDGA